MATIKSYTDISQSKKLAEILKGKYIGKSLTTGNIETFENQTYDKGGWSA